MGICLFLIIRAASKAFVHQYNFCVNIVGNVGNTMLKRELLRLLPQNFQALRIDRASMALNNQLFSARLCSFSQFSGEKESASIHTKTLTDRTSGSRVLPSNALSLKSCLDRHDGVLRRAEVEIVKANPVAPCRRPVHDSELFVGEVAAAKTVNGNGACRQGKCFRFPKYMVPEKLVVAVDVDEGMVLVLWCYLSPFVDTFAELTVILFN